MAFTAKLSNMIERFNGMKWAHQVVAVLPEESVHTPNKTRFIVRQFLLADQAVRQWVVEMQTTLVDIMIRLGEEARMGAIQEGFSLAVDIGS